MVGARPAFLADARAFPTSRALEVEDGVVAQRIPAVAALLFAGCNRAGLAIGRATLGTPAAAGGADGLLESTPLSLLLFADDDARAAAMVSLLRETGVVTAAVLSDSADALLPLALPSRALSLSPPVEERAGEGNPAAFPILEDTPCTQQENIFAQRSLVSAIRVSLSSSL